MGSMKKQISTGALDFRFDSNRLCLDFLATRGGVGNRSVEHIATPGAYSSWIEAAGILDMRALVDTSDVSEALKFRELLQTYFAHIVKGLPVDQDIIGSINEIARRPSPRLELDRDGRSVLKQADRPGQAALSSVARDVMAMVTDNLLTRVKRCDDPACRMLFLDSSPRNNRIWCSTKGPGCGNKAKKRAFRSRQKEPVWLVPLE